MSLFKAIKEAIESGLKPDIISGTAFNIDASAMSFDLKKNTGGRDLVNVKMRCVGGSGTMGIWMVPKDNSQCIVLQLNRNEYNSILLTAEEFETLTIKASTGGSLELNSAGEVLLNGDQNKGLVKVVQLVSRMNEIENKVNTILAALQSVVIPLAPSGTYPFAPLFATVDPLVFTVQNDIENPTVKH